MHLGKTFFVLTALFVLGCGAEETSGSGAVSFSTWGEDLIEKEIPSSMFADGWTIKYTKFLVVIGDVRIADETGAALQMSTTTLYDHHTPGVKPVVTFADIPAQPYPNVSYAIRPASVSTSLDPSATAADLAMMTEKGLALYVEGSAEKGAEKKTFHWGFGVPTAYTQCRGQKDGREILGVLVTNGGTDDVELTIHGDHLFYDDLQSPNAARRFDAIASADADGDGEVTLAELAPKKLVDIDPASGGYGTGSAGDVNDLGAFVTALSRTVGHFRGEGECISSNPTK